MDDDLGRAKVKDDVQVIKDVVENAPVVDLGKETAGMDLVLEFNPDNPDATVTIQDANDPTQPIPHARHRIDLARRKLPQPMSDYNQPDGNTTHIRFDYASIINNDRTPERRPATK